MIYFDACALLKLAQDERESEAMRAWRERIPHEMALATSELARVEICRTLMRSGIENPRVSSFADQILAGITELPLTGEVLARAKDYGVRRLGTLDAIHLASAEPLKPEMDAFITYDRELIEAAMELGFPVRAPG